MSSAAIEGHDGSAIRVTTGSRLHFGLFDVKPPFGGVGLMVDHPRTRIVVDTADSFEVRPCHVDRIAEIASRVAQRLPIAMTTAGMPNCKVIVESAADPHRGLGSGTQLALATALAMSEFFSLKLSRQQLVQEVSLRGRRSSIGSIGFFEGGLIAENGRDRSYQPCSGWRQQILPEAWRIVLASPPVDAVGVSGEAEGAAFAALAPASREHRAELVRLSEEMMRASEAADFDAFSALVAKFNARSGELFAAHQGGCFNGEAVRTLVDRIMALGVRGVGQSSWGPTVFALCENEIAATRLSQSLDDIHCRVVKPQSAGYELSRSPSTSCK